MRYLEDIRLGDVIQLGEVSVERAEMLDYATRCDRQPAYREPEAEGLCARGWAGISAASSCASLRPRS